MRRTLKTATGSVLRLASPPHLHSPDKMFPNRLNANKGAERKPSGNRVLRSCPQQTRSCILKALAMTTHPHVCALNLSSWRFLAVCLSSTSCFHHLITYDERVQALGWELSKAQNTEAPCRAAPLLLAQPPPPRPPCASHGCTSGSIKPTTRPRSLHHALGYRHTSLHSARRQRHLTPHS